jgi:tetratricopeptide (TPR) repeat protein
VRTQAWTVRYTRDVFVAGRRREIAEIGRLLDRAGHGTGGTLAISGPPGSGKTVVAGAAADDARHRGMQVLWASPAEGQPGRLVWGQLLRDTGAPADLAAGLLTNDADVMRLDSAARHLVSGSSRLIVIDDIDQGGPDAIGMLSVVAARAVAAPVALIVTAAEPLGLKQELRLGGLSEAELRAALGGLGADAGHALWLASRGLPGVALRLASELADLDQHDDPVVRLALRATSAAEFLEVDTNLVRLLETAVGRARDNVSRARLLARLAHELLGDASAAPRRRALADEALSLARQAGDPGPLADVLDARLHALWDPEGAADRVAGGSEITDLARAAGDTSRERHGTFWRFVGLMELGRIAEAESALAAFAREAAEAGDAEAAVLATARHAMLAVLHGRFDQAGQLTAEVSAAAHRIGLPDAESITMTLWGSVAVERGLSEEEWQQVFDSIQAETRQRPGHLFEASIARLLAYAGRTDEAAAELERVLPRALVSSGPRWLGVMSDLAFVAAAAGARAASAQIYEALTPYRERLVMLGGAASSWGPVPHYLGLAAATMGRNADAVGHFSEAIEFEQRIGALPYLAHSLAGLADALTACGNPQRASASRARARQTAQRLGMTVLLQRLGPPASEWALVRDGDDWVLTAGDERARLRDGRGLHYLRALLAAPGRDIRCLDLASGGAGLTPSDTGPVLDAAARGAYQRRLGAVTAELDAADRAGDSQGAQRAEAERQALLRELRSAAGLGGHTRNSSPEAERARVNVTRTLRATIDRIALAAPGASAHLRTSVRTGGSCRYEPAPGGPDRWVV